MTRSGLLVLFVAAPLVAQRTDTTKVAPMVVTATRLPISAVASPASVSVVTGEELRLRGVTSIADALRGIPGVTFAQSGGFGGLTSLFLRGGESKYVKVLVDGAPINDPGGAFDFGALTVDNVDRMEIVRGPASVLYGADAVTGVIQIFTKRGSGVSRVSASARGGTYGSVDADASVSGGVSSGDFSLALARHDTRGIYAFNSAYHNTVLSGGMHFFLDDRTDLRASLRYTDYVFHYPTNGGGDTVDVNALRANDVTTVAIELGRRFTPRIDARLSINANGTAGGTDDGLDKPQGNSLQSIDRVRRRGADLRTNVAVAQNTTLTLGAQVEQQDQRTETQGAFGTFQFNSVFRAARRNDAGYAQLLATLPSSVVVTTGARVDHNEQFGSFGTYRAAASWAPVAGTHFRASVGSAFREPTFFENYSTGSVTGNPALEPERTASWEVGVRQSFADERVSFGITHFAQRFRNMIDYAGAAKTCGFSYCNVARASADGRELEARWIAMPALSLDANLTHTETKVLNPGYDTTSGGLYRAGEALIRRPTTTWNAGAAYSTSHGGVDVRVSQVGARPDRDFRPFPAHAVVLPAYTRTDVGAELPVSARPGAALTLRVENVFDVSYQSIFNFKTPGRTVLVGARVVF